MNYLDGIMSGIEVKAKIGNEQFKKAEAEEEEFRQEFSKAKDTWGKRTVDSEGTIFHESIFISLSPFLRVITEFILRNPCSLFYSARTGVQNLRGQITSGCFFKGW